MAEKVHFPQWQAISQDTPEPDGLSGIINYEIENDTPILIGDEQVKDKKGAIVNFFKTPDEEYAIPGTSVKGMIRNWIEIVTHSRLSIINDVQLSYRDLGNNEYTKKLTKDEGGQRYKSLTKSGWLKFEEGQWQLYPTQHWRVENSLIKECFNVHIKDKESPKIYKKLGGIKTVGFNGDSETYHKHSQGKQLFYAKATKLFSNPNQGDKGCLVVTGQVSNTKHMNFIFSDPKKDTIELADKVLKGFHDINQEKSDYLYLKELNHPNGIPVFYIEEGGRATQMGLAQMFRFPYQHTVGELRYDSHSDTKEMRLDFAEILFGKIQDDGTDKDNEAIKGRVSFSLARHTTQGKPIDLAPTVLGSPKSSFYPAYINQSGQNGRNQYNTYNQNKQKLSGFKRYAIHLTENRDLPNPPVRGDRTTNYDVATQLRPLPKHQKFQGKIRFHNLKPEELGAILLALKITEYPNIFHNIGMAKSYGYGKIFFQNVHLKLSYGKGDDQAIIQNFEKYLNQNINAQATLDKLLTLQNEQKMQNYPLEYVDFNNGNGFREILRSRGQSKISDYHQDTEDQYKILKEELEAQAERQKQQQKKSEAAEQAKSLVSEETQDFLTINQFTLELEASKTPTNSLIKNIAKELNVLHKQYTGQVPNEEIVLSAFNEVLAKLETIDKPVVQKAIKKIKRDIL